MSYIPNYTKNIPKLIGNWGPSKQGHLPTAYNSVCQTHYAYTVKSLITGKFFKTVLLMLTGLNYMKILLKTDCT